MRTIPFGKPVIGDEEKRAAVEVLDSGNLAHGPRAQEFEQAFAAYAGAPQAVSVSSCTAGLHLFYFAHGIGPGDEVIVPAQTHVATAHAVELCGARPVFVDAEAATGNIDIDQIEGAITSRTRAVSVVHFLGLPVDMLRVCGTARKHDLLVLEDCALAIGSRLDGVHVGLWGDAGCFSFYPVKHITTGEGGMVATRHADLAARLRLERAFGVDRGIGERTIPGVYDVVALGFNYRMNEIEAALGLEQLRRMPSFAAKRRENFQALAAGLAGIEELEVLATGGGDRFTSSHYCLSAVLKPALRAKRAEIVGGLRARGVGTSVYYPRPVPHLRYYEDKYGYGPDSFPAAAGISSGSISLPVGPHLGPKDMEYIVESLKHALSEVRP
jgi:dTDP-4-amino-4,6-dideoxygalactose transaminase